MSLLTNLVLSLPLVGAYGIFAIGIVLIYRASRMLNLAHGAMAMVPAYVLYALHGVGVPLVIAFPMALAVGAGMGMAVERVFVRRLRSQGATAQTVGTVAVLGLLIAGTARAYGTASVTAVEIFPRGDIPVGASVVSYGQIGLFAVMVVVCSGLYLLIARTDLGLMMRGAAESRLAASLMGVNPSRISLITWAIGGATAALAGILLASVTTLDPYTLPLQVLPAFIAALIGGMGSLPGALLGALIVGSVQGVVPLLGPVGRLNGAPQLILALLAIVVMATRGKKLAGADDEGEADARAGGGAAAARPAAAPIRTADAQRRADRGTLVLSLVATAVIVAFPFTGVPSSYVGSAILAASYAIIGVSLVLLTGWVGQISLGHAALVGIGSYATGHIVVALGVPFPLSLPLTAGATGAAAALLGAIALRVRGLYLAVATLVFSWMASEFLFRQSWFTSHSSIPERPIGTKGEVPYFDFADRRTFYLLAWATLGIVVFAAANLKRSKTGRAFFAIRGSEMAAASLGVDVMRYKIVAFAASGAIAGAAGCLIMTDARVVSPDQFTFNISLFYVAIAVVGGLTSIPGAVSSGLLFAGLSELFFRVPALGNYLELVSAVLLAVTLLAGRGGLAAIPHRLGPAGRWVHELAMEVGEVIAERLRRPPELDDSGSRQEAETSEAVSTPSLRDRVTAWLPAPRRRHSTTAPPLDFAASLAAVAGHQPGRLGVDEDHSEADHAARVALLAAARAELGAVKPTGTRDERIPLIQAENVTVRFGGLVAVNDASLTVREGEIVGLIGPNGAGKTTLFNAIAGYNSPTSGTVHMHGVDVTEMPVHKRAQLGVARTFQLIQLFRDLSVRENLLVATHVHNPTGVLAHTVVTRRSLLEELAAFERVGQVIELLGLESIADTRAGDLPFGVLRMVEVARALVTGFRVVMLDEPASGLDDTETDGLMEVLRFVRGLGVTLLLIEHDVRMVTSVSDHMYVLERGTIIAEGAPEEIQRNPEVIAAYLGEPAGESGSTPAAPPLAAAEEALV